MHDRAVSCIQDTATLHSRNNRPERIPHVCDTLGDQHRRVDPEHREDEEEVEDRPKRAPHVCERRDQHHAEERHLHHRGDALGLKYQAEVRGCRLSYLRLDECGKPSGRDERVEDVRSCEPRIPPSWAAMPFFPIHILHRKRHAVRRGSFARITPSCLRQQGGRPWMAGHLQGAASLAMVSGRARALPARAGILEVLRGGRLYEILPISQNFL